MRRGTKNMRLGLQMQSGDLEGFKAQIESIRAMIESLARAMGG
jgi:hypothetical protein